MLAVLAVVLVCLLTAMAVDALFTVTSLWLRWLLPTVLVAAVGVAIYLFVIQALRREVSLTAVARMVEEHHPELQERISSAFELMAHSSDDRGRQGSAELIGALAQRATMDVKTVDPRREVTTQTARPYLIGAAVAAFVLAAVFLLWPQHAWLLLSRVILPRSAQANVHAISLTVDPEDCVVPLGEPLTITATTGGAELESAELEQIDATDHVSTLAMLIDGSSASLTIPAVMDDFRFRIRADSAITRYYEVTAATRPQIERLEFVYDYPDYTKLPTDTVRDAKPHVEAIAGTKVNIRAFTNKPLEVAGLELGEEAITGQSSAEGEPIAYQWSVTLDPGMDETAALVLMDEHEFENEPVALEMIAVADERPTIKITRPQEKALQLRPDDTLPLAYSATDDFGVATATILVSLDGGAEAEVECDPPQPDPNRLGRYSGEHEFDLSSLDLDGVSQVALRFRVTDNLPEPLGGPQQAMSELAIIHLLRDAATFEEQQIENELIENEQQIDDVIDQLREAQDIAEQLAEDLASDAPPEDKGHAAAEALRQQTAEAEETLREMAEDADAAESPFARQREELGEIADEHVAPASEAAEMVPLADTDEQAAEHAEEAAEQLGEAIARLEDTRDDLQQTAEDHRRASELGDLAERQQELADQAAENAVGEEAQPPDEAWQEEQQNVADEIAEMLPAESEQEPAELTEQQRQQAADLAQASRELADQQDELREMSSSLEDPFYDANRLREQFEQEVAERQQEIDEQEAALNEDGDAGDQGDSQIAEARRQIEAAEEAVGEDDLKSALQQLQQRLADQTEQLAEAAENQGSQTEADGEPNESEPGESPDSSDSGQPNESSEEGQSGQSAAHQLARAQQQAQQASDQLSPEGQPSDSSDGGESGDQNEWSQLAKARENQSAAARALREAAESLEQMAGAPTQPSENPGETAQDGAQPSAGQQPAPGQEQLAQAQQEAQNAAQAESGSAAAESADAAAQMLQQAASAAAAQAQQPGQGQGQQPGQGQMPGQNPGQEQGSQVAGRPGDQPGQPGSQPGDGARQGQFDPDSFDPDGAIGGGSSGNWTRFRGKLRGNVTDEGNDRSSGEFRHLIERYFEELARQGNQSEE